MKYPVGLGKPAGSRRASIAANMLLGLGIAAVVLGVIGGGALIFASLGFYNVAATQQHSAIVYSLFEMTKRASIKRHAQSITPPNLADPLMIKQGFLTYRVHCIRCHGAPGVPPSDFAMGLTPGAPPLSQIARQWSPQEMYWTTRNGIKMTGMPAWEFRLDDADIWNVVAFLHQLPAISPLDYCAMEDMRECGSADQSR